MGIIKSSLIYKIISGFFVACRHSKIGLSIGRSFKASIIYKIFFVENSKMMTYANNSYLFGNVKNPNTFTIEQAKEEDVKPKLLTWLLSSFFMKMIITWKDCEQDDKYN